MSVRERYKCASVSRLLVRVKRPRVYFRLREAAELWRGALFVTVHAVCSPFTAHDHTKHQHLGGEALKSSEGGMNERPNLSKEAAELESESTYREHNVEREE